MFVIVFSGITSALGLYFLSKAAARTEGREASFFAVSQLTWPSAAIFFDLAIAIKCFGVGISYMLIVGDIMPQVMGITINLCLENHNMYAKFLNLSPADN
jgi:amino acid permease